MFEKTKLKFSFNNMKIRNRLALVFAVIIIISFSLIAISMNIIIGSRIKDVTDRGLSKTVTINKNTVENINNEINNMVFPILDALDEMYSLPDGERIYDSLAEDVKVSESRHNAEAIINNTLKSLVQRNEEIVGAGIFFEHYGFSPSIKDYSPYITKNDASNGSISKIPYETFTQNLPWDEIKSEKEIYFSDPFKSTIGNHNIIAATFPIVSNGELKGVVDVDINCDIFSELKIENSIYSSIYVDLINNNNNIVYSTNKSLIGTNIKNTLSSKNYDTISKHFKTGAPFVENLNIDGYKVRSFYEPVHMGNDIWFLQTSLSKSDYNANSRALLIFIAVFAVACTIVIVLVAIKAISTALNPLDLVLDKTKLLSAGNLDIELDYNKNDEIGEMIEGFSLMISNLKNMINNLTFKLTELSNGNFCIENNEEDIYIGDFKTILDSLNIITNTLNKTLYDIKSSSEQVDAGANQVSDAAQNLSQGAVKQASSLEKISAGMIEIQNVSQKNAEQANKVYSLAAETGHNLQDSIEKMNKVTVSMNHITKSSNEITNIIKIINEIAFQTNILALNASIEAARAGEAGKGFSVVASEVGNLANKTQEAAANVGVLIEESSKHVTEGNNNVKATAAAIQHVFSDANTVVSLISDITEKSAKQKQDINILTASLEEVSSVVQTNSATAEESAAASEELSAQSNIMNNMIDEFNLKNT